MAAPCLWLCSSSNLIPNRFLTHSMALPLRARIRKIKGHSRILVTIRLMNVDCCPRFTAWVLNNVRLQPTQLSSRLGTVSFVVLRCYIVSCRIWYALVEVSSPWLSLLLASILIVSCYLPPTPYASSLIPTHCCPPPSIPISEQPKGGCRTASPSDSFAHTTKRESEPKTSS